MWLKQIKEIIDTWKYQGKVKPSSEMSGARASVFQSSPLLSSYLVLQIKFKISIHLAIIIGKKKKTTFIQMLSDHMGMSLSDLTAVPDPSPQAKAVE